MEKRLAYPDSDKALDPTTVLLFFEGSRQQQVFDANLPSLGRAVLVAPSSRDSQKILLLPDANFVRGKPGKSEIQNRTNTIAFLVEQGAVRPTKGGQHLYAIKHILFPNPSRCSSCISRTQTNGWVEWQFRANGNPSSSLEQAWKLFEAGKLDLTFYHDLPDDTVEVPFRF